jgi:threonine dehydratase
VSELAATAIKSDLSALERVHALIRPEIICTPLLSALDETTKIKPECLQRMGSFKLRAACAVLQARGAENFSQGVITASAGNFGQGLAYAARARGLPLTVHVPETAAATKIDRLRQLGAHVVTHSFAKWWEIMSTRDAGHEGHFIHPVCELEVIQGNASIGLELLQQWPAVDTIVVPFGGGGLISGIALAFKAAGRDVRMIACEAENSTPLRQAFDAGRPVQASRSASFIDGIGSEGVLPEMWPLLRDLVDDVVVVTENEARKALADLCKKHHIVAEGAGAVAYAAAARLGGGSNVAAIVSGGNIDLARLSDILSEDLRP